MDNKKLLVATHNKGKVTEFANMLADMKLAWLSLDDAQIVEDVAETGTSFWENALLKAQTYAAQTRLLTLADDSGLEVDALGGEPGVYTARYGGAGLDHVGRYRLLLQNLADVPWEKRTARFRCAIAIVGANGELLGRSEGVCEGLIALEPAGNGGFGYDPVFYLPDFGQTMAQVGTAVKQQISHRGRAMQAIEGRLRELLANNDIYHPRQ
ncbi:MAG: RdgB/HAM1 family non-canonical purine NTP pyrophosphatase [Ardenticatenaceae bacterium]|nr:RdgB/HAM1 family non-canonical purine NTP pyrophosphatase [Anaerolineales bacterium]MCB8920079.1 RdgB/HAM1 family non-canonical purine NTP pyrophosphatase [Ardenticatenaceae bacterium]